VLMLKLVLSASIVCPLCADVLCHRQSCSLLRQFRRHDIQPELSKLSANVLPLLGCEQQSKVWGSLIASSRKVTLRISRPMSQQQFSSQPNPNCIHSTVSYVLRFHRTTTIAERSRHYSVTQNNVLFQQDATHQFAIHSPAPPSGTQLRDSSLSLRAAGHSSNPL
jgi:hypothetical protein